MNLLKVNYSAPGKLSRFYVDGRRVTRDAYLDALESAERAGRSQNSFHSITRYDAAGNATRRDYSAI